MATLALFSGELTLMTTRPSAAVAAVTCENVAVVGVDAEEEKSAAGGCSLLLLLLLFLLLMPVTTEERRDCERPLLLREEFEEFDDEET